jgi:membrane protein required for colicin V production
MNYLDLVLLIPLAYAAWKGFRKGFVIEVFTLLAFFFGIYAGVHFSDYTAEKLAGEININNTYMPTIAFTLTFLVVGAIVFFAGKAVEKLVQITALSPMNKMGGLVFGSLKMLLIISVLFSIVESYSEKNGLISAETRDASVLYEPVKAISLYTIPGLRMSNIFIQNALQPASDSTGLQPQELYRAKQIADSLGVTITDAKQLYDIHQKYN